MVSALLFLIWRTLSFHALPFDDIALHQIDSNLPIRLNGRPSQAARRYLFDPEHGSLKGSGVRPLKTPTTLSLPGRLYA